MMGLTCYKSDGSLLKFYTQWDVDQKLIIGGADTSSAPDFHFMNAYSDVAYVVQSVVNDNLIVAPIPDILLQDDVPLIVYIEYEVGTTEYSVRIPIIPRAKPEDYVFVDIGAGNGSPGSGSYETITIINNLTTNDPLSALSAAQGVVIARRLSALEDENIGSGVLHVTVTDGLSSHNSQEIYEAIQNGIYVFLTTNEDAYVYKCSDSTTDTATFSSTSILSFGRDKLLINSSLIVGSSGNVSNKVSGVNGVTPVPFTEDIGRYLAYTENGTEWVDLPNSVGTGENGATFTPYVDSAGNLSWTNDKGLTNPATVNIKGEPGMTPVRGTHYWTTEDIAEIKSYVDEAILGGAW